MDITEKVAQNASCLKPKVFKTTLNIVRSALAAAAAAAANATTEKGKSTETKNLPGSAKKKSTHAVPVLEEDELNTLAKRFGEQIPDDEMSVASLQGYLLKNKTRPRECVDEVAEWCVPFIFDLGSRSIRDDG